MGGEDGLEQWELVTCAGEMKNFGVLVFCWKGFLLEVFFFGWKGFFWCFRVLVFGRSGACWCFLATGWVDFFLLGSFGGSRFCFTNELASLHVETSLRREFRMLGDGFEDL